LGRKQPDRQSPKHTFFVDVSVSSAELLQALRDAGHFVVTGVDLGLPPDTLDVDWIPKAAEHDRIILTKDKRSRRFQLELDAYRRHDAAAFVLTAGNIKGAEIAAVIMKALPRACRLWTNHNRPLIATIGPTGSVTVKEGTRRGGVKKA
jgi:predicted nuclease of predicted toxin-antitoxin system